MVGRDLCNDVHASRKDFTSGTLNDFGSLSHFFGVCRFSEGSSLITCSSKRYLHKPLIEEIKRQILEIEYPSFLSRSIKSIISGRDSEGKSLFLDDKKSWNFLRSRRYDSIVFFERPFSTDKNERKSFNKFKKFYIWEEEVFPSSHIFIPSINLLSLKLPFVHAIKYL